MGVETAKQLLHIGNLSLKKELLTQSAVVLPRGLLIPTASLKQPLSVVHMPRRAYGRKMSHMLRHMEREQLLETTRNFPPSQTYLVAQV